MDCTCITFSDGKKEIRYWIDHVLDTKGIDTYLYATIPNEQIEEIENSTTDKVQEILSKIF